MADTPERDTHRLKKPIRFGSETIAELHFRAAKAKDFRRLPLEGITMGHILDVMGALCGQPPAVMDELEGEDLREVSERFAGFIGAGPLTGATPSP